ncbi:MAG: iron-sulfur cluster assembly accessory protein [Rhodobacteraceae bacterium]|nr:iron-sulfur cluster assembly accessory protein [Paracoccaceae bacterium]
MIIPPKVSDRAYKKLAEVNLENDEKLCLRVAVKGGGCSGFQYEILLDKPQNDDLVLAKDGQAVLIDEISLPFLQDATIDYTEELIGSRFTIVNPNAKSTCGCSLSFSL